MTMISDRHDSLAAHFLTGMRACLPVAVSVGAYGLVWGVLARSTGLSAIEVMMMSGLVFAGSAQFVALDLWDPLNLPIGPIILATLIVNLRYMLLTATLRPLYQKPAAAKSMLSLFLVTDENWAMTVGAMTRGGGSVAFMAGGGALIYLAWMCTNLVGYGLGSAIDDPSRWGLDFAFTATFLSLLLGMWKGKTDLIPWLVAALAALVTVHFVSGSWYILVGGLVGSFAGAVVETRKHVRQS